MKLSIFAFLFIFLSQPLEAQITYIPDSNFEEVLIFFGLDSGSPDGQVMTSAIDTLTSLFAKDKGITNLTGIQDFTALKSLNCSENELTELDVTQNIHLTILDCRNNDLSELDLSQNAELEYLQCKINDLDSLDLTNNPLLFRLDFSNNSLSEIDLTQNFALEYLTFIFNSIEEIDLSNNLELIRLVIGNNPISHIDITHNSKLRFFEANFSDLEEIDVTQNDSLINFQSIGTSLSEIDFTQNLKLRVLRVYINEIDSIDLSQNVELREVNLVENNLSELDVSNNTALEKLFCSRNNIAKLDLSKNINLTDLFCTENNMNCLNIKNGNNLEIEDFFTSENPMLTCIQVDDSLYSTQNWLEIDSTTTFSDSCNIQCTEEIVAVENLDNISRFQYFPNPTSGNINIIANQNHKTLRIKVYNISGQKLLSKNYENTQNINFELTASAGIYFVTIEGEGNIFQRIKIIKN